MIEDTPSGGRGRRRPVVIAAIALACAAIVGLLVYGLVAGKSPEVASRFIPAAERTAAPALRLPLLDGEPTLGAAGEVVSLERFRGRTVVVNFWASWCEPCKEEAPVLNRLAESEAARGVQILGVNLRDPSESARRFVRDYGLRFPSVRARTEGDVSGYDVPAVPQSYVIDREGRLAAHIIGSVSERALADLLDRTLDDVAGTAP